MATIFFKECKRLKRGGSNMYLDSLEYNFFVKTRQQTPISAS